MARRLVYVVLLVLLGIVLLVGLTGYQALKARTALQQTAADLETFRSQLSSGDLDGSRATLADAQKHARDARGDTDGPGWWLTGHLPQIGPNVRAVQSVSEVTDRLTSRVLPDVVTAAQVLDPTSLRPRHGRVELAPIQRAEPAVVRASTRLHDEAEAVRAIDTSDLAPQIAAPVDDLRDKIDRADQLADRASRAVRLLPSMLGADGPRRYLFLFQNNAEIRSTGGIPGAFATMVARDGKVTLGSQGDAGTLGRFPKPVTRLTRDEKELYGPNLGSYPQDVNFTPDFPRSAEIISAMDKRTTGRTVDGVVSVDPVALSYLLRGTGPVRTAGDRTLQANTVVQMLLSKVYAEIQDPAQQNVFYNEAARSVFDAVSAGKGDPRSVLNGLVQAASERRMLVWSAHPDEQKLLTSTAMSGGLDSGSSESPHVGVYFNAAGAYKLDYYLDYTVNVGSTSCQGGRQHLQVDVAMRSSVPKHNQSLPNYVNPVQPGFGRGKVLVNAYVFAPEGGKPTKVSMDGKSEDFNVRRLGGRSLIARTVLLKPGQTSVLSVDMVAGHGQDADATLRVTPGVRTTGVGTVQPSACS